MGGACKGCTCKAALPTTVYTWGTGLWEGWRRLHLQSSLYSALDGVCSLYQLQFLCMKWHLDCIFLRASGNVVL